MLSPVLLAWSVKQGGEDVPWALSGQNQTRGPLAECPFFALCRRIESWSDHQTPRWHC